MKKAVRNNTLYKLIVLFLLLFVICAFTLPADEKDIVILLDVSQSVFSEFTAITEYLIKGTLERQMDMGDYFHLLTFADDPDIEISRQINSKDDITAILKEILLIYPFGEYTDLIAALNFLHNYADSLPEERKKVVVILTDGIHDPPPGRYETAENESGVLGGKELREAAETILENEWDVRIVEMPEGESAAQETAEKAEKEGEKDTSRDETKEPSADRPEKKNDQSAEDAEKGMSVLTEELDSKPYRYDRSDGESMSEKVFDDQERERQSAQIRDASLRRTAAFIILGIAAVVISLLLLIVIRRKSVSVSMDFKKRFRTIYDFHYAHLRQDERPIEMHVEGQNPNIGLRNVQVIKEGKRLCVGGKGSSFLIFLVSLPRCVGVIERKNDVYTFIPLRTEYFPENGRPIEHCLDRDLVLFSEHGRKIVFRFSAYVSKLEKINKIMHLIDQPGLPS